jgi:hypothetical protein
VYPSTTIALTARGAITLGELLIRAGYNDHQVIGDLLTPGGAVALRPPIDRLVADAQTAAVRPTLAESAHLAGIAYLIDPVTPLLQSDTDPVDSWVRRVPFGVAEALDSSDFDDRRIAELSESTVVFQVERGATAVIPPYLYAADPDDPALTVSLRLMIATRRFMRKNDVNLPLVPVFCGGWQRFARQDTWTIGVDRFLANALDVEPESIALCLTPLGADTDSYSKVARVFATARRFVTIGIPVIAWRQGTFGAGLVAAGLAAYETGAGTRERADVRNLITRKKPRPGGKDQGGPTPQMVFLEGLGRSVRLDVARALLGDLDTRARLICDDESCCPQGVDSMLDHRTRHTINARAQRMRDLNAMPHGAWKLHQVAKDALQAVRTTKRATMVLQRAGLDMKLSANAQESLARIAEHLRKEDSPRQSA